LDDNRRVSAATLAELDRVSRYSDIHAIGATAWRRQALNSRGNAGGVIG
jgi:hypothetical protein